MNHECATQYENKFVLAFGQNQKDLNRKDMQKICRLNLVALMPVSVIQVSVEKTAARVIKCFLLN